MLNPITKALFALLALMAFSCQTEVDEEVIRHQILDNGEAIRQAFADGDLAMIRSVHHPDVIKALGYQDIQKGREEVMQGIEGTLDAFTLEFVENEVENLLIQQDLVIEQTKFSIRGTPKDGGDSFVFSGRTMVTYVRYGDSPTGWATIREIIQPATD
ncbi:MAG: nuclear transport factor 2 family protein [Bacteroidota bacterium]